MSQAHFNLQQKCNQLEARNTELETENQALNSKGEDMAFEIVLLRDISGYDEGEEKDWLIEAKKKLIQDKDTLIAEKDAEIVRLQVLLAQSMDNLDVSIFDEEPNEAEVLNPNKKMGEDVGEILKPPTKKRIAGIGHDFDGVRYAQYYGRLNKACQDQMAERCDENKACLWYYQSHYKKQ